MTTTKKASPKKKDETITEKIGHVISDVTDSIAETYNKIVHPADKKKAAKKATPKPSAAPAKKAAAKKAAPKKMVKAAAKK